ncbi:hypothetical protein EZV61_11075 [Corallincola luteus]|uniref:DUF6795 domain-containing protein n=1 Tax=Corallincola luteus TaxID=1775177 RepID=A0ABY2ALL0_9GAMM|nr:DUF6795 domain-containing protein [Corallincola luteus]TCI03403.1 hypothetical protein EZV61_11075 [Corallincola luteus]
MKLFPTFKAPSHTLNVIFLLFLFITGNIGMFGLFKKFDVNLCPEVKGQILLEGKPVSGVKITRSLTYYYENERLDYTTTDDNGQFSFPEVNIRSRKPGSMFDVSRTYQELFAERCGQKYKLWRSTFHGIEKRPEYERKLGSLNCDLTSKLVKFEFKNNKNSNIDFFATSLARWSDDFIIFEEYNRTY